LFLKNKLKSNFKNVLSRIRKKTISQIRNISSWLIFVLIWSHCDETFSLSVCGVWMLVSSWRCCRHSWRWSSQGFGGFCFWVGVGSVGSRVCGGWHIWRPAERCLAYLSWPNPPFVLGLGGLGASQNSPAPQRPVAPMFPFSSNPNYLEYPRVFVPKPASLVVTLDEGTLFAIFSYVHLATAFISVHFQFRLLMNRLDAGSLFRICYTSVSSVNILC